MDTPASPRRNPQSEQPQQQAEFTQPELDRVLLYSWPLDLSESAAQAHIRVVSEEEHAAISACTNRRVLVRRLASRAGLRLVLGRMLGCEPASLAIEHQALGKPYLADPNGLSFSISHSSGRALLAVSRAPVGVDIEREREVRHEADLVGRWFSPAEAKLYRQASDSRRKRELFFRLWTGKEAIIKLFGGSIGEALRKIEPPLDKAAGEANLGSYASDPSVGAHVYLIDPGDSWAAALATHASGTLLGPLQSIDLERWTH